jgi:hypothetical protein
MINKNTGNLFQGLISDQENEKFLGKDQNLIQSLFIDYDEYYKNLKS